MTNGRYNFQDIAGHLPPSNSHFSFSLLNIYSLPLPQFQLVVMLFVASCWMVCWSTLAVFLVAQLCFRHWLIPIGPPPKAPRLPSKISSPTSTKVCLFARTMWSVSEYPSKRRSVPHHASSPKPKQWRSNKTISRNLWRTSVPATYKAKEWVALREKIPKWRMKKKGIEADKLIQENCSVQDRESQRLGYRKRISKNIHTQPFQRSAQKHKKPARRKSNQSRKTRPRCQVSVSSQIRSK